jgi:hypothetical protein
MSEEKSETYQPPTDCAQYLRVGDGGHDLLWFAERIAQELRNGGDDTPYISRENVDEDGCPEGLEICIADEQPALMVYPYDGEQMHGTAAAYCHAGAVIEQVAARVKHQAEELERTKGQLAAMQRDRDALAARVRELEARPADAFDRFAAAAKALKARGVLDTIEVTVEHGGEELTLDVEITRWATRATHTHPPEGAEWRAPSMEEVWLNAELEGAINDQVQAHCAERAAPGREG